MATPRPAKPVLRATPKPAAATPSKPVAVEVKAVATKPAPSVVAKPAALKPVPVAVIKEAVKPTKVAAKAMPKFAAAALAATREPVALAVEASTKLSDTIVAATPVPPVPSAPIPAAMPIPAATKVIATMEKTIASFARYEEITAAGKANIDALVEANSVFFSGFQALSKEMFSLTQASFDQAAAVTTAMLSAKTLKDVMELNSGFAKSQYEKLLHDTSKLGELTVKLATETAAPLAARATHAVESAIRPLA